MKITVIGHLPPPVTGENLCRLELVASLRSRGVEVTDICRRDFRLLFARSDALFIYSGKSLVGTCVDLAATFIGLWRHQRVYWCFHNIAWRRFCRLPTWMWLGSGNRIVPVVLRRVIAEEFIPRAYRPIVLNNCPALEFEHEKHTVEPLPAKRLLWVGRIEAVKGFDTALECFRLLKARDGQWCFDVYGGTAEQAREVGFYDENVTYHGFISGDAKVAAISTGGIFLLPSRYLHETQPLSIIEAFSQGVPVVASRQGGIQEMIETREVPAGVSLESGTAEDYARAVEQVFANYEFFSKGAKQTHEALFSRARFASEVLRLVNVN